MASLQSGDSKFTTARKPNILEI
uniref:Uncharacterized protein n=1 Tax=Rhizophora mucronata TaxID=61149 RepID=A0A2P2N597_RHIMU